MIDYRYRDWTDVLKWSNQFIKKKLVNITGFPINDELFSPKFKSLLSHRQPLPLYAAHLDMISFIDCGHRNLLF